MEGLQCPGCANKLAKIVMLEAEVERLKERYIDLENAAGIPSIRARVAKAVREADARDEGEYHG